MIIRELGQIKPEIDERAVEVPQDGWNVTSGGVLYTQNASSCSVAAIYSPENNTGWLGHFANVSQEGKKTLSTS